tara:strand:+ start:301 stop:510 length:210 start_codon:yes stop_codon:yes gene_type:complete
MKIEYDGISGLFFATARTPWAVCLACSNDRQEAIDWLFELLKKRNDKHSGDNIIRFSTKKIESEIEENI